MQDRLLIFAAAIALAGPCLAEQLILVSVSSSPSCTFPGLSFQTSVTQTISAELGANINTANLVVTKTPDACSPSLYDLTATGTKVPTVIVSLQGTVNGINMELRRVIVSNVVIASIVYDGVAEHITFGYDAITLRDS